MVVASCWDYCWYQVWLVGVKVVRVVVAVFWIGSCRSCMVVVTDVVNKLFIDVVVTMVVIVVVTVAVVVVVVVARRGR